jgi:Uma2 family endonuclease
LNRIITSGGVRDYIKSETERLGEAAQRVVMMSVEDYLASEEDGPWRHEFVNGVTYAMAGSSTRHNKIAGALYAALIGHLPARCEAFISDVKVRIESARDKRFYYPDVFVSCSQTDSIYTRDEPILVAEVLSPWTERIDRGEKFEAYKTIVSLQEYAILSQDDVRLELFRRRSGWEREVFGPGDAVTFDSVDLAIELATLYRRTGLHGSQ